MADEQTIERLIQKYLQPDTSRQVPPHVSVIMLRDGTFWEGSTGVRPLISPPDTVTIVANVPTTLFAADDTRNGARLLNYGASPVYLSPTDPPASGPPSEFIPQGAMDQYGNIWPGQFEFSYRPVEEWFALSAEDGQVALFVW